ncbi:MAG TPA: hypothetical protein VIK87_06845 [Sphingomonadales bacterium]
MPRPAVIVRTAGDVARAVQRAGSGPLVLLTAPGAAAAAGPLFLKAMTEQAATRADTLVVIDCDDDPGLALLALRSGWRHVMLTGPAADQVASAAASIGARIHEPSEFPPS